MTDQTKPLSFITLLLMISFASVNAVLFTPALPEISHFFAISNQHTQLTITWFLIGYALGQLIYGPLANRFGRKPALYYGISLQILSSFLCIFSGIIHSYGLLIVGRFLLALGAGVGLKMTFTLVNETYPPKIASQKISYLTLAFAITPALSIALGGVLVTHFSWMSCFYVSALYGLILLILCMQLPETKTVLDGNALKFPHLFSSYLKQFKNIQLVGCSLLMGGASSFVYVFAATAPFVAINLYGMNSSEYGLANLLPSIGLMLGSLFTAQFMKTQSHSSAILLGIIIISLSSIIMALAVFKMSHASALVALFIPMILSYFGLALIFSTASTFAMANISDKAHASAVMNFLNMGTTTVTVLGLSAIPITKFLLPLVFIAISIGMITLFKKIIMQSNLMSASYKEQ